MSYNRKHKVTYFLEGMSITVEGINTHAWGFDLITRLSKILQE